jgi:hypothetical protein
MATHTVGYKVAIGWFGVVFFGWAFVIAGMQLFRRGPSLVMSEEGISGPRMGSQLVRWSEIASVSVREVEHRRFLCLWLHDTEGYVARLPPVRRLAAKSSMAMGFPPTAVTFTGLTPGLPQALEYVLQYVPSKTDIPRAQG